MTTKSVEKLHQDIQGILTQLLQQQQQHQQQIHQQQQQVHQQGQQQQNVQGHGLNDEEDATYVASMTNLSS